MSDCDICGSPRMNGAKIRYIDGAWRTVTDRHRDNLRACRSCARERVGGERDDLSGRADGELSVFRGERVGRRRGDY